MDKKALSERDICTKFITPALKDSGWDIKTQIREEQSFTAGKIFVRGKLVQRGKQKRIVEKVNELMSLCNALEEKLTKKEETAEMLVGAVVNAVANKSNKHKDEKADKKEKMKELIKELIEQHPKELTKLS